MTITEPATPNAKRVRVQVIDVFHGIDESGASGRGGGSPARIGFFLGDEEEQLFLQIEDCPVTAIAREATREEQGGREVGDAGGSGRGQGLPPADYHLGDTLDVCPERAGKAADVHIDFDYLASQMTQGPTQDHPLCIQNLVKQGNTPIGRMTAELGGNGPSQLGQAGGQAPGGTSPLRLPPPGFPSAHSSPSDPAVPCPRPRVPPVPPSAGGSIFKTGKGVTIRVDPQRIAAANRLLDGSTPAMRPEGESIFSTGAGKALAIDPEKVAAHRLLLDGNDGTPRALPKASPARPVSTGSIFSTGSGMSIQIDPAKLAASRRLLGEEGRGPRDLVDRASPAPSRPCPVDGSNGSVFQTGAGSSIKISREKVAAAKKLLEDAAGNDPGEHRKALTPMMSRFAPNRMETGKIHMPNPPNTGTKPLSNTPGHDLLRRPPSSGAVGIKTPRMATPQNAFGGGFHGGNAITPGSSLAGSANRVVAMGASLSRAGPTPIHPLGRLGRQCRHDLAQFDRHSLPITPDLASKFAFSGMYGPGDVRAHQLSTGAVPEIVSDAWVRNHYKWVVWKLAMVELYAEMQMKVQNDLVEGRQHDDDHRLGSRLHYDAVKEELSARYNREYVEGKRSFLKGVLQRDYPFGVPCVLKVASIAVNVARTTCTLLLTDGWYGIYAECDKQLLALTQSKKLFIGQKLRICGAELTGGSPGDPLEVAEEARIILSYNQVHPVAHGTKLGAQSGRHPITPLSVIDDKGGRIPRTVVSVLRMFPRMVWSKLPSGVSTFQTSSKAGKAEASLEIELERIYSQVRNEIDQEDLATCKSWIQEGKAGGIKHVERLYAEMVVRGDTQFGENLNTQDRADLETFILERRAEMEQERRDRVGDVLGAECPAAGGAKTTPCQTMLVGEVSNSMTFKRPMEYLGPEYYSSMSLLTVWNCEGVREGDIISVSSLESFDRYVSSQAHQGPFLNALKHLVTTKTSEIKVLPSGCVPPGHAVVGGSPAGRTMTTRGLLDNKKQGLTIPNLFDVDAIVVLTSPVLLEDCLHRQWVFAIDYVEEGDGEAHPWVLAIKLSGPQDAIRWFEKHTGSFVSHFGNVSLRGYDAEQRFVQLQGSMGTELRSEVANGPHLNEVLTRSKGLLASLKTRLVGLMG